MDDHQRDYGIAVASIESYLWGFDSDDVVGDVAYDLIDEVIDHLDDARRTIEAAVAATV